MCELTLGGVEVDVGELQSEKVDHPMLVTHEVPNLSIGSWIPRIVEELQEQVQPSLPWAEDHFLERVGGKPLNPGKEYKNWPWYKGEEGEGVEKHKVAGQFSHTYMERYWPKQAGFKKSNPLPRRGVRFEYGDLDDVVNLLARSPHTRQAYLPVWFPEDTGVVHGERVPCTLGYHFFLRSNRLHVVYYIRSCDAVRHFRNDVYLTCRLVQWVQQAVRTQSCWEGVEKALMWEHVKPGTLTMHITSFHCFKGDLPKLEKEYG
jgi:thymidylate synthase